MDGIKHSVRKWCRLLGISQDTFYYRINKGWTVEQALLTPLKKNKRLSSINKKGDK